MKYVTIVLVAVVATLSQAKGEDFSGFYAGVVVADAPSGNNDRLSAGVLSGYRFSLTDGVRLGVEGKASAGLDSLDSPFWNVYGAGTAGFVLQNTFFFAKGGVSTERYSSSSGSYDAGLLAIVGAGLEFAPNDLMTFRAEAEVSFGGWAPPPRPYSAALSFGVLKYF